MEMAQLDGVVAQTCWNYCGHRMAAAGADGTIQVWDATTHGTALGAGAGEGLTLTAHWKAAVGGPTPKVIWAPPEYGDMLASCSANGAISVWEEVVVEGERETTWRLTASLDDVHSPILDMQFGDTCAGLKLVAVFADGHARIYETADTLNLKQWQLQAEFQNARTLVEKNMKSSFFGACVCWKSPTFTSQRPAFVFGCNSTSPLINVAKVWEFEQSHQRWFCIAELRETDEEDKPVNHVSWAPNIGRPYEMIAVASGDGASIWQVKFLPTVHEKVSVQRVARLTGFDEEVWQVEWDMSGMTLASSGSDGVVRLWQANLKGEWQQRAQIQGL